MAEGLVRPLPLLVAVLLCAAGCQATGGVPIPPEPSAAVDARPAAGAVPGSLDNGYDLATAQRYADAAMKRQECFARMRGDMRQMQAVGTVGNYAGVAAGMAGPGGRAARKGIGLVTGRTMRAQAQQMQAHPC
jgi:hypothetical protein